MIRVRILKPLVTMPGSVPVEFNPGDVVDWPNDDAQRLFKSGYAEPHEDTAPEPAAKSGSSKK